MDAFEILSQCENGHRPTYEEAVELLSCREHGFEDALFDTASALRDYNFGRKLFMYGFVYFSTYCKNNCNFCYYRNTNGIERYRKNANEIVSLSESLRDAGVNMVDLTMGEDTYFYDDGCRRLIDLVKSVRRAVDIGIMISPGAVSRNAMYGLREAGADWFACYQETYNRDLYSKLRVGQDYDHRVNQRIWAREAGLLTEDGMLVGTGESAHDRAEQIFAMGKIGCQQIRAMTFVPQPGTPMQTVIPKDSGDELRSIAVMRLCYPDKLIPASLDVEGTEGLQARIAAGANVITSIVPPKRHLAGVAQPEMDIDDGHRSVEYVKKMVEEMGRRIASDKEFSDFMDSNRPEAVSQ